LTKQLVYAALILRVHNMLLLTIKYKLSTKPALLFFEAKKESKKLLGNHLKPQNALRLILF